jgi:hypothetical protein
MLYDALIFSGVLLLAVNIAFRLKSRPKLLTALIVILPAMFFFVGLPPVMIQAALIGLLGLFVRRWEWGTLRYATVTLVATFIAFILTSIPGMTKQVELAKLRERYPFESLEGRLPPTPEQSEPKVSARLEEFEEELDKNSSGRAYQLERLHERSVRDFVNSDGFGAMRIIGPPSERSVARGLHAEPAPFQPPNPLYGPTGNTKPTLEELAKLHSVGVIDFLNPKGFGYIKDRQHVAGFQSHGFSKIPKGGEVEVARLELVSLLMHK